VHPSVAAFARTLLAGTYVTYNGDPLRDLTLTAFLDKFVQRKPKVCTVYSHKQLQSSLKKITSFGQPTSLIPRVTSQLCSANPPR